MKVILSNPRFVVTRLPAPLVHHGPPSFKFKFGEAETIYVLMAPFVVFHKRKNKKSMIWVTIFN